MNDESDNFIYNDSLYGPSILEMGWVPAPRYLLRRARVFSIVDGLVPGHLLEIGCGAGTLLWELDKKGFTCDALESSASALDIARKINSSRVNFHAQPEENWCDKFDYLFAFEVLEHIEDDLGALLEWSSWIKPGGALLISVPSHMRKWTATDTWAGHYRRYERNELEKLLKKTGFTIERFECYGYPVANIIAPLRASVHARQLEIRRNNNDDSIAENTAKSSLERSVEVRLYPILKSPVGKLAMRTAFWLQNKFINRDFGEGYLLLARKNSRIL